jgi:DNA mismatch endonuclease (patch repair protein)
MADHLTPEERSRAMKRVKLTNGSLELSMQRALRERGHRFQRHERRLPGRPDIVFSGLKLALFVDGDFWHGWRLSTWQHKLSPFWREKLQANRIRDQRNFRKLRLLGWTVIRFWEHQLKRDLNRCIECVEAKLLLLAERR